MQAGHSARRIVHAEDVTGKEIERALLALAAADPNIALFEHHLAVDLVCVFWPAFALQALSKSALERHI